MPAPLPSPSNHTKRKWRRRRMLMRKLWNEGDSSLSDIAEITGTPVDRVELYLASQPGWPNIVRGRVKTCSCCNVEFQAWGRGNKLHCSLWCREETRRRQFWASSRKRRREPASAPPPRRRLQRGGLSPQNRKIVDAAGREAKARGVSRDAVLREWKFVPERSTTP